jgi:hypothetical protein
VLLTVGLYSGGMFLAGARFSLFLVALGAVAVASYESRRLNRVEERRQAAVSWISRVGVLAADQPSPNAQALPLPYSITQYRNWLAYVVYTPSSWVVLVLSSLLVSSPESVLQLRFFVISFVFAAGITVISYLAQMQRIIASDVGLSACSIYQCRTILWSEARLFAIDGASASKDPPESYELSSATTIVRWNRQTSASRFYHLGCPFEEYDRQMNALLSLIAAKTGLPLHDLRQGG